MGAELSALTEAGGYPARGAQRNKW